MEKLSKEILVLAWRKEIEVYKKINFNLKKALEVAKAYDGKVINKRFTDALKSATVDMGFSLDFSGSYPTLFYYLSNSCLRYDLPKGDYKLVSVARYPVPLCVYENRSYDFVEYIDCFTRRLSFLSFRRVVEQVVECNEERLAEEEKALKDIDKVLLQAMKINEQIKKMRADFPYHGFGLESERLGFNYIWY